MYTVQSLSSGSLASPNQLSHISTRVTSLSDSRFTGSMIDNIARPLILTSSHPGSRVILHAADPSLVLSAGRTPQ